MMNLDLFDSGMPEGRESLGRDALVLRGFGLPFVDAVLAAVDYIEACSPFRHMQTRRGYTMSVALTNCGRLGWISDRAGYRYSQTDPLNNKAWPEMPADLLRLATQAADAAGFRGFEPDACLINSYLPGSKMALHQDRNEADLTQPIVSVSLGIPAIFLFGGHQRSDKPARIPLFHGDIVVWGGEDRMRFHGIMPLKAAEHPRVGARRINLTFRRAG